MERNDADDVVRLRNDPAVRPQLFCDEPLDREGHLRWFERMQKDGIRHEFIIVERATGRSIGITGLNHLDRQHRRAEYGIVIGEAEARGKGLAFEASRLLLNYAFNKLRLHRVYLHVFTENEPALRLYRKIGFTQEGLLRQHVCKNGRHCDVVVMALLQGERRD
jgi:UDP-4-amino-4,6-dideoxy-N-acetyl-beta-L-altrosamine N-acetyltransferase